jgi:hypothetical protein
MDLLCWATGDESEVQESTSVFESALQAGTKSQISEPPSKDIAAPAPKESDSGCGRGVLEACKGEALQGPKCETCVKKLPTCSHEQMDLLCWATGDESEVQESTSVFNNALQAGTKSQISEPPSKDIAAPAPNTIMNGCGVTLLSKCRSLAMRGDRCEACVKTIPQCSAKQMDTLCWATFTGSEDEYAYGDEMFKNALKIGGAQEEMQELRTSSASAAHAATFMQGCGADELSKCHKVMLEGPKCTTCLQKLGNCLEKQVNEFCYATGTQGVSVFVDNDVFDKTVQDGLSKAGKGDSDRDGQIQAKENNSNRKIRTRLKRLRGGRGAKLDPDKRAGKP